MLIKCDIKYSTFYGEMYIFWADSVEYLGRVLSKKGIGMADAKVEAVRKARAVKNYTEQCSFLILVHYYGKFMHQLAEICHMYHI